VIESLCQLRLECGEVYGFLANVVAAERGDEVVDGDAHGGECMCGYAMAKRAGARGDGREMRGRERKELEAVEQELALRVET